MPLLPSATQIHTCGAGAAPDWTQKRPRPRGGIVVDVHCHVLTPEIERLVANHPGKQAENAAMNAGMGEASVQHNRSMLASVGPRLTSLEQRLRDMDAMGVDVQLLSPSPNQYCLWADAALSATLVGLANENIAGICADRPDRFRGLGMVSLQEPELAATQLRHAMGPLGLHGVEIATAVPGRSLADPALDPFWSAAQELGAFILLHPLGADAGTLLDRHYLWNTIGQPLETTRAVSELICGGTFDRYENLRFCTCHGGGFLPFYRGRADHAHRVRPEAAGSKHPPSHYLRRLYYDTVVHDAAQLRTLIDTVGVGQVLLGTDYPFDMGDDGFFALLDGVPGLDDAGRRAILGGNAAALLGLDAIARTGAPA